jgi:hypothetical protein
VYLRYSPAHPTEDTRNCRTASQFAELVLKFRGRKQQHSTFRARLYPCPRNQSLVEAKDAASSVRLEHRRKDIIASIGCHVGLDNLHTLGRIGKHWRTHLARLAKRGDFKQIQPRTNKQIDRLNGLLLKWSVRIRGCR